MLLSYFLLQCVLYWQYYLILSEVLIKSDFKIIGYGDLDMAKLMNLITSFCFIMTLILSVLCHFDKATYLTLTITFATIFYHFGIRLLIGFLYNIIMKNQADYTKKWYQLHSWEYKLYQFLRVKQWKNKLPTYNPGSFSNKKHTWNEIAQTMCQSELVHETNVIFSFFPIIASKWFGSFYVFFITSICAALFDLIFVIVQRYNRVRVVKIALKKNK